MGSTLCTACFGAREVHSVRTVLADGRYQTIQGYLPCPVCGDPSGPTRQRPSGDRPPRPQPS